MLCTARMREQMKSINELRYWLFCLKKGDVDSKQLPPRPVMTHFASMHFELTIKPQIGNEGFNDAP